MDMIGGDLSKIEYDLQQKGFQVIKGYLEPFCLIPDSKNTDSPFSKLQVRQALDYAIDRDSIVKSLGYGFWIPTYQFAIPGTPSYVNDFPARSFDLNKSKQMLAAAGYPSGFKTSIIATSATSNRDVLVAIQSMLSKVNITVDINMVEMGASVSYAQKGWNNALLALGKSVDSNMPFSLNTNWTQTCPWYVSIDKTNDFQALYNAAAATPQFDPATTQRVIRYMSENSMITTTYILTRGQVAYNYVHDTGLYTLHNWPFWKPADIWLSK